MRTPRALILSSTLVFAMACGDDTRPVDTGIAADTGSPDTAVTPDAAVDAASDAAVDATTDAAVVDTWSSFAMEFFATYCTECHSGGTRDYRTIDEVRRDAATIRCGVSDVVASGCGPSPAPMQFPIGTGPRPSVEERQRLVAWIDAGLSE